MLFEQIKKGCIVYNNTPCPILHKEWIYAEILFKNEIIVIHLDSLYKLNIKWIDVIKFTKIITDNIAKNTQIPKELTETIDYFSQYKIIMDHLINIFLYK